MKRLILLILTFAPTLTSIADCIFDPNGIIHYAQSEPFQQSEGLVWVGEPIEEIVDETNYARMIRMQVIEVWCGDIKKTLDEGAPEWASEYINTDDEVFIYAPYGTSQDFSIPDGRYIITSPWYSFSYSVSNCFHDYLPIDVASNEVTGNIHGNGLTETIALAQLKNEILGDTSCTTSLGIEQAPFEINVFPNPSNGLFQIQLGNNAHSVTATVRSIDGRIVSVHSQDSGNFSLDISSLEAGIYILDLLIDETFAYRQELVKI